MATELDHDEIKKKIVAILKANASLFTTTAEEGELRSIEVGYPQGDDLTDAMPPYAFVTNSKTPFETIKSGTVVSNAIKILLHTFNYDITVVVNEADSRNAEVLLDELQKLILQTLEADHNLTGTGSASVDDSAPLRIDPLTVPNTTLGKGFKGRVITLRCQKATGD